MYQIDFLQLIQGLVGESYRDLMFVCQLFGGIWGLVLFKAFGYKRHNEDRDKVPVTAADILGVFIETKIPYVLSCKSQFCSKQTDGPGDLQPQQEHR